jgi:hypothetical protein
VVPGLIPDVYAAGAMRSGLVEPAQSRLQMWDRLWWSSSLSYSDAKTTAWAETPSHTIAEATRSCWAVSTLMPFRMVGVIMSSIYLVGIVALIWAPETKGQPLPED